MSHLLPDQICVILCDSSLHDKYRCAIYVKPTATIADLYREINEKLTVEVYHNNKIYDSTNKELRMNKVENITLATHREKTIQELGIEQMHTISIITIS